MHVAGHGSGQPAPLFDGTLSSAVDSGSASCAVGKQPKACAPTGGHGDDTSPRAHIALPVAVPPVTTTEPSDRNPIV
jgi:hypothetical protein